MMVMVMVMVMVLVIMMVTCHGSGEVFNVNYEGFWLISLLEAGGEEVKVNLESFKVGGLGPFAFLGVWGDQEELLRYHKFLSGVKN